MRCAAQAGGTAQAGGHGATGACGLCTYAAEHMVYIYLGKYIVLLIKKDRVFCESSYRTLLYGFTHI